MSGEASAIDCMACLVALARGWPENGAGKDRRGITHATYSCESYGAYQAYACAFRKDGGLTLVPR
jgi:hypothetical protein